MLVKIELKYLTTENNTYSSVFKFCCDPDSMPFFEKEIKQAIDNANQYFAIGKILSIKVEASIDENALIPENQGEKKSCEN